MLRVNFYLIFFATLMFGVSGCSQASTDSVSNASVGPTSPGGYYFYAEVSPSIQTIGIPSTITATVTNGAGNPVSGVTVEFLGTGLSSQTALTNASGVATIQMTVSSGRNDVNVHLEDRTQSVYVLGQ